MSGATLPIPTSRVPAEALYHQPLIFLQTIMQEHSDLACLLLPEPLVVVVHPAYVHHILTESLHTYHKMENSVSAQRIFGSGLVTSNGNLWRRQRRLLQPIFHQRQADQWGAVMVRTSQTMLARWHPLAQRGEPVDVVAEMTRLTLNILSEALFGLDMSCEGAEISQTISALLSARKPAHAAEFETAALALDALVARITQQRRSAPGSHQDVLTVLLQTQREDRAFLTDALLRDEIVTLLIAGHETTAAALSWVWYLLAHHQDVEQKLHQELGRVLGGAAPTCAALSKLPYTRMIVEESMRLFPPVWATSRRAKMDDTLGPYTIPAGAHLLLSPYATQRHPVFWEDPDTFNPERFSPDRTTHPPRFAHFPFGAGPRQCIGARFAMQQMLTIIAAIVQRYRLHLAPGVFVKPAPLLSLRPEGLLMMLEERAA